MLGLEAIAIRLEAIAEGGPCIKLSKTPKGQSPFAKLGRGSSVVAFLGTINLTQVIRTCGLYVGRNQVVSGSLAVSADLKIARSLNS